MLAPACSAGESGGGGWWDGVDRGEEGFACQREEGEQLQQPRVRNGLPRGRPRSPSEVNVPSTAPGHSPLLQPTREGPEPPRSPPLGHGAASFGGRASRGGGGAGAGEGDHGSVLLYTRSQIHRMIDDAVRNGTKGEGSGAADAAAADANGRGGGLAPASAVTTTATLGRRAGAAEQVEYRRRDRDEGGGGGSLLRDFDSSRRGAGASAPTAASAAAATPVAGVYSGGWEGGLPTRAHGSSGKRPPTSAFAGAARSDPPGGRTFSIGRDAVAGRDAGGGGGSRRGSATDVARGAGAGSVSSWAQLGPRAVTREDLARLDNEIANLSKTVEQAR